MQNKMYKFLISLCLVFISTLAVANTCLPKSDAEYQQGLIGSWHAVEGPDVVEMKQHGLELRFSYDANNNITLSLGYIGQPNSNLYTASGYYYLMNGSVYFTFYHESDPSVGLINIQLMTKLKCMDNNTYKDEEYTYKRM